MAIIDYLGIENAIKALLAGDSRTNAFGGKDTTIEVESEFILNEAKCPYIAIFLNEHETIADTETIGGSTPYLTRLSITVWCYDFSLENLEGATNRVLYFQFVGGEFDNQKNTSGLGFFKGVSLNIDCEVKE